MSEFFCPDRTNRPGSSPVDGTREIEVAYASARLVDGRPVVRENALVDGFFCVYFYFDAKGLEQAEEDELVTLLRDSNIRWPRELDDGKVYVSAAMIQDAQNRDVWEIQITFPPLD